MNITEMLGIIIFDVTPEEIEYEGYFNTATEVHRVNNNL